LAAAAEQWVYNPTCESQPEQAGEQSLPTIVHWEGSTILKVTRDRVIAADPAIGHVTRLMHTQKLVGLATYIVTRLHSPC